MINVIVGLIIAAMLAAAVAYIVRAKKKGVKCIGCPAAETCGASSESLHSAGEGSCAGCGGGCGCCAGGSPCSETENINM